MADYKITENVLGKEPTTCIWRVQGKVIENYLNDLFQKHDIDGFMGAQVSVEKTGNSQNNHVNIAVFFKANSNDITGGIKNGQGLIRQSEVFGIAGYKPSTKLAGILTPLARWNRKEDRPDLKLMYSKAQGGVCALQINPLKVFTAMLNATDRQYSVSVIEALEQNGESIIQIAKTTGNRQSGNKPGNPLKNLSRDMFGR